MQTDGSFKAKGLNPNGTPQWESDIKMSLEFKGKGIGNYKYIEAQDHGVQQVTYLQETRSFSVLTTDATYSTQKAFVHRWKRIEP